MSVLRWNEVQMYPASSHQLVGATNIKNYCMGGNAIVTLTSPTKAHYTYYIRAPFMDDKDSFRNDIRFVYYLNNTNKWTYVGGLYEGGTCFKLTRGSRVSARSPVFKGAVYLVKMMNHDFDTPMLIQHEGCCSRCGRRLTDPLSIERGLGPRCYKQLYNETI